jgi:hypothetical protein
MLIMERPIENIESKSNVFQRAPLPPNTTGRLVDVYNKEAFQMFRRYLITDKVYGHPGNYNPETKQYDKLDLDYQLIVKDKTMIISRSDKPIIPVNEKITEKERRMSESNVMLYRTMTSVSGQRARGYTTTYKVSDEYHADLDKKGFERVILEGKMIEHCINHLIDGNFEKCRRSAVINWYALGFNRAKTRNEKAALYKIFCEQYLESLEYLERADNDTIKQFLYYSIVVLIRRIIYYQR